MSSFPDAWTAVRGRPWRFLRSAWPWRSLLYLISTVPVGVAALIALLVTVGVGALTLVVVVGFFVLIRGVPAIATIVAGIERGRLRLVFPHDAAFDGTFLERLRAVPRAGTSWAELGHAFLLATVLWVVDMVVVTWFVVIPVILVLSPVVARVDSMVVMGWTVDSGVEIAAATVVGLVLLIVAAYGITVVASAQAALTRLLLDQHQPRLAEAVRQLRRSRVGLVDAFEAERRRIERDLHDGAQQRLVALTMTLGRAELELDDGAGLELVRQAHHQAEAALDDLRATVRGIHPQVLTDHGVAAAVNEIAARSAVPVETDIVITQRLPGPVEAAAYFVASESLTNVARHAQASLVRMRAWIEDDDLVLTVTDDGVGGAEITDGGGLAGLLVRLDALDGSLTVTSPRGGPTKVRMTCPISPV